MAGTSASRRYLALRPCWLRLAVLARWVVEGQGDLQGGARPGRAVQPEVAAERLGPVPEPDQAGAVADVRAATETAATAIAATTATERMIPVRRMKRPSRCEL